MLQRTAFADSVLTVSRLIHALLRLCLATNALALSVFAMMRSTLVSDELGVRVDLGLQAFLKLVVVMTCALHESLDFFAYALVQHTVRTWNPRSDVGVGQDSVALAVLRPMLERSALSFFS